MQVMNALGLGRVVVLAFRQKMRRASMPLVPIYGGADGKELGVPFLCVACFLLWWLPQGAELAAQATAS